MKAKELSGYPNYIIEEFSEALGKTLYPVGLADNGHIAIVKDNSDKVYCIDGSILFYVAGNIEEALSILSKSSYPEFTKVVEI